MSGDVVRTHRLAPLLPDHEHPQRREIARVELHLGAHAPFMRSKESPSARSSVSASSTARSCGVRGSQRSDMWTLLPSLLYHRRKRSLAKLAIRRSSMTDNDLVILLDDDGREIGTAPRASVHGAETALHLAFSCHVMNDEGQVLITRRALDKRTWPGVWTNAFCGHPAPPSRSSPPCTGVRRMSSADDREHRARPSALPLPGDGCERHRRARDLPRLHGPRRVRVAAETPAKSPTSSGSIPKTSRSPSPPRPGRSARGSSSKRSNSSSSRRTGRLTDAPHTAAARDPRRDRHGNRPRDRTRRRACRAARVVGSPSRVGRRPRDRGRQALPARPRRGGSPRVRRRGRDRGRRGRRRLRAPPHGVRRP